MAAREMLNKVAKFYIEHNLHVDTKKLSEDLQCSISTIKAYIRKLEAARKLKESSKTTIKNVAPPVVNTNKPPEPGMAQTLMGKKREATVLTPAASQHGDENRAAIRNKDASSYIFKMRKDG